MITLRRLLFLSAGAALLALGGLAIGRAAVWFSQTSQSPGLSAPPQVFLWEEPLTGFGGYSALIMDPDGMGFIAGSDRQHYLTGQILRDETDRITGTNHITRYPVRLGKSSNVTSFQGDLEALTRLSDGRIGLAFENFARIQIMDAPGDLPKGLHSWKVFEDVFSNELFEGLATLPGDHLLALFERGSVRDKQQGQTVAYIYDGTALQGPFPFPVTPGFDVSGADVGPDGCLYILERRYGVFSGFLFQLIRMDAQNWMQPRSLIYRSKPMSLGNGEAVSVWQNGSDLVATVITDNGFPPLQPTRLIELPLSPRPDPAHGCADQ